MPPPARRRAASGLEFSPDTKRIAAWDASGVSILDAGSQQELERLEVPGVTAVAFSPKVRRGRLDWT